MSRWSLTGVEIGCSRVRLMPSRSYIVYIIASRILLPAHGHVTECQYTPVHRICETLFLDIDQSTHSKYFPSNHSSLVRHRSSPSIGKRIFGKYSSSLPSMGDVIMRALTDPWTLTPRFITSSYTSRPSPRFQLTTNVINDTVRRW